MQYVAPWMNEKLVAWLSLTDWFNSFFMALGRLGVIIGLSRIVALYYRSSTSYQIC